MRYDELFDGKYKIIKELGRGGMGTVHLAENVKLGTLWAIKQISKKSNAKVDILVEPNILKKLNHPALPRIFDILEDNENIYVIVDYIEGTTLDKELAAAGKFSESTVVEWARQICDVLIYLHSFKPNPIIYRDMKPSNIMLTGEGRVKLIDFGIAREYKQESRSDTVYIGTRGYAAPEQYGAGQTNAATDIYSLGVTLYHLLTGKGPNEPPYEIKPVRYFDENLSAGIENIISRCTRQDPWERYQWVKQLLDDLNKLNNCGAADLDSGMYAEDTVLLSHGDAEGMSGSCKVEEIRGRVLSVSFKKLRLTVLDNAEFAAEMSYISAKLTGYRIIVIDLNFTDSKLDVYFNLPEHATRSYSQHGFHTVYRASERNSLNNAALENACVSLPGLDNLYILTEPYNILNYEKYKDMDVAALIESAYRNFDITVIVAGKSIFDTYTRAAMEKSDYNIVSVAANTDAVRVYQNYIKYMGEKCNIPLDKTKFIAYEYKKDINLPISALKRIFADESYCGYISYDPEREYYRNLNSCYAGRAFKKYKDEYIEVLSRFNIMPKQTLGRKVSSWILGKG